MPNFQRLSARIKLAFFPYQMSAWYRWQILKGKQEQFFWQRIDDYINQLNGIDEVFMTDNVILYNHYFQKGHVRRFAQSHGDDTYEALGEYFRYCAKYFDFLFSGDADKHAKSEPVTALLNSMKKLKATRKTV